jgi:NAD(P)-dependent dehydrogenase (short-subunit alcohol dehydrogenase family)
MQIKNSVVLVTGANRGIGRSFVKQLLAEGAKRVYATARDPQKLAQVVALDPERVVALRLDITDPRQVDAAAAKANDVTLLINNAGTLASYSVISTALDAIQRDIETNYLGTLRMARAFAPALEANHGAMLNVLTLVSLASMPAIGGYSASKAAAWSLTQSLRAELATKGIAVHGVYPGAVDTDMIRDFEMPKTSPDDVAVAALHGLEAGTLDIAPDPMSKQMYATWLDDPKAVERQFASM